MGQGDAVEHPSMHSPSEAPSLLKQICPVGHCSSALHAPMSKHNPCSHLNPRPQSSATRQAAMHCRFTGSHTCSGLAHSCALATHWCVSRSHSCALSLQSPSTLQAACESAMQPATLSQVPN